MQKWLDLRETLMEEFRLVKDIHAELNSFKERNIGQHRRNQSQKEEDAAGYDKDVWPAPDPPLSSSARKVRKPSLKGMFQMLNVI